MENTALAHEPTDIIDLLGESDVRRVLLQCGVNARKLSHYELFRALCAYDPLLTGHVLQKKYCALLSALTESSNSFSRLACDALWRLAAERLLLDPHALKADCMGEGDCTISESSAEICDAVTFSCREHFYAANRLLVTHAEDWETWREWIESRLDPIADRCDGILYRLPRRFIDRTPNPYAVGQILKNRMRRSTRELDLLHAQLLRHLFHYCRLHEKKLILLAACAPTELAALLSRLKREVGLPSLAVAAPTPTDPWLLDLTAQDPTVTLAVDAASAEASESLEHTLMLTARDYPMGRITVIR